MQIKAYIEKFNETSHLISHTSKVPSNDLFFGQWLNHVVYSSDLSRVTRKILDQYLLATRLCGILWFCPQRFKRSRVAAQTRGPFRCRCRILCIYKLQRKHIKIHIHKYNINLMYYAGEGLSTDLVEEGRSTSSSSLSLRSSQNLFFHKWWNLKTNDNSSICLRLKNLNDDMFAIHQIESGHIHILKPVWRFWQV